MNKITNTNMFNWSKKKQKYETEEPKVRRKGSFSLTDTLRRSVIKAKFKQSKEDVSITPKEDISTKPPRPQPPKKNTESPNKSAPLAKPENVDLNNEISQITLQVSQMTADAQLSVEDLKVDDGKVTHNKNPELTFENNEDELNKEEVKKANSVNEDSPVYDNVHFETTQINPQVSQMAVGDPQLSIEELKIDDGNEPCSKDLESPLDNNMDELNKDAQLSVEDLKVDDGKVPHNKNPELILKNNEEELNKEEVKKSNRIYEDSPVYDNVHFETTQINPQVSQNAIRDPQLNIEELNIDDGNVPCSKDLESPSDNNVDELNKEEVEKSKIISQDDPVYVNVNFETTQLNSQVSQVTVDDANLDMEKLIIDDKSALHNNNQESTLDNNEDESNKEEVQEAKIASQDKPVDVNINSEETQLMPEVSQMTDDEQFDILLKELEIDNENVLHNNDEASPLENNDEGSHNEEIQKSNRISQVKLDDINVNSETTQLTVQVSQTAAEDSQISIEELKINDENIIHNKELESPLEVNEEESNKVELRKSRRISQISFEKEDMAISKKEDITLNGDESNSYASDDGVIRRNSTIRRSIKLELTIIESQDTNTSRRNSRTSPEKEINRCSFKGNQTDYPEELNPFAEEEENDAVTLVNSEKQNSNNQHYNPFDSESDTEDTIKEENKDKSRKTIGDNEINSAENNNKSCALTTRNKNQEASEDKTFSQDESKCKELPGGSLPPSPKAPARRRLPQTRSLQCLNEYSDPAKKIWQSKKSSSTLSKSNTQSDNHISSSTLEEKGEDFINSEDNLNMNGKPTQLPKSSVSIHTTSSGISSAGSNPFDDDDDENEVEETSRLNKPRLEVETQRIRSSSPSPSLNSVHSTPSKSLNPFDEDEEDSEFESGNEFGMMRGATSRSSLAYSPNNSISFKRDTGIRGSLPPSRRTGVKKRLAPLPPGQLPPISPDKKGNSYQSNGSLSSSSPRKVPPPRPPPPRVQKIS